MAKSNLKIKTSTSKKDKTFLNVTYKSKLEKTMAMLLYNEKLPVRYEEEEFTLFPEIKTDLQSIKRSINGKGKLMSRIKRKHRAIKYTPDFCDYKENLGLEGSFIIEVKGYPTPEFILRYRLFERYCTKNLPNVTLYMPRSVADCEKVVELIKENYVYRR